MPETDVFPDEPSSESKTTESLKEHRKQIKRRKKVQEQVEPSLGRDVLGWISIVGAIAWLLMLISFDPNDPSMLHETSKMVPDNYLGKVGANISAYCFEFMGFGNYALPLCAIYLGFLCIRIRKVNDWFFQIAGGGTVVFVFLIFLGGFSSVTYKGVEIMPGGLLGMALWRFFSGYLNPFGTYLFLFGITGLAVLVTTQLTLGQIGSWLLRGFRFVGAHLFGSARWVSSRWNDANEERTRRRIATREFNKLEEEAEEKRRKVAARFQDNYQEEEPEEEEYPISEELPQDDFPQISTGPYEEENPSEIVSQEMRSVELAGPSGHLSQDLDADPAPRADTDHHNTGPVPRPNSGHLNTGPIPDEEDGIVVNPMKAVPKANKQESFQFLTEMKGAWVYPSTFLFNKPDNAQKVDVEELRHKARSLKDKFEEFKVTGEMAEIHPGPVVTTYEFKPDGGIKYSKITNLADDLCLALGAESVRIDRMPGRSSVGLEVPNNKRELITFREMIESNMFQKDKTKLLLVLGKTIDGTPFAADLAKMPHLLIAGQTGSGKSVGINAMLCSILMRNRPDECKLILIDPKMVEMGIYADIPHLLTPVVTDPLKAANALKWAVNEMEIRYKLLASHRVRNLEHFNQGVRSGSIQAEEGQPPIKPLPSIVVCIDEMADLMMVARGEVEESVARLAQKSRAIGIHLILATQRPSVDIITGVIKSNLPSRLAYRVAQRNDSRIILDANGADKLLGKGDGLFLGPGTSRMVRIHAPYLSETEVIDLVKFLKNQGEPDYNHAVLEKKEEKDISDVDEAVNKGAKKAKAKKKSSDPMYEKAARLVVRSGQASVSYLQRKMGLGYARAAKLVDMMEEDGIVGPSLGSKARDILVASDFFDEIDRQRME